MVLAIGSIIAPASARAQTPEPGVYTVGQTGSAVDFTVYGKALLPIKREGRFKEFAGEVSYDPGRPHGMQVDLTVYTRSVDTNNRDQNQLLKSDAFFDVEHFPTMHFSGTVAGAPAGGPMMLTGDLTIRGITKRISAPVTSRASSANPATVFETNFQIDRTEFGLNGVPNWHGLNVSFAKNVQIHIAIAAGASRPPAR